MPPDLMLEVPSNVERLLTGLVLTARKLIRGKEWRCEIHNNGVRLFHQDKLIAWEKAPTLARKFAHQFVDWYNANRHLMNG